MCYINLASVIQNGKIHRNPGTNKCSHSLKIHYFTQLWNVKIIASSNMAEFYTPEKEAERDLI